MPPCLVIIIITAAMTTRLCVIAEMDHLQENMKRRFVDAKDMVLSKAESNAHLVLVPEMVSIAGIAC